MHGKSAKADLTFQFIIIQFLKIKLKEVHIETSFNYLTIFALNFPSLCC